MVGSIRRTQGVSSVVRVAMEAMSSLVMMEPWRGWSDIVKVLHGDVDGSGPNTDAGRNRVADLVSQRLRH